MWLFPTLANSETSFSFSAPADQMLKGASDQPEGHPSVEGQRIATSNTESDHDD